MKQVEPGELGMRIRSLRKQRGMTLDQVAKAAGTKLSHISEIERGHTYGSVALLYKVAAALGTTLAELLTQGTFDATASEPAPVVNDGRPIYEMVMEDVKRRAEMGKQHYGTFLQANNGRNSLVDLYAEMLDAVCYLRQMIEEQQPIDKPSVNE